MIPILIMDMVSRRRSMSCQPLRCITDTAGAAAIAEIGAAADAGAIEGASGPDGLHSEIQGSSMAHH